MSFMPGSPRSRARRSCTHLLIAGLSSLALFATACSDSTSPGDRAVARYRVVNSVFQGTSPAAAVPVAIDVLIDSSTTSPGIAALAPTSLSSGNASGRGAGGTGNGSSGDAATLFTAAGYRDVSSTTHTIVSRVSGSTGPTSNFYRSAQTSEYLPHQYFTPFPYTLVVAGIVPPAGTASLPTDVPVAILTDDPFAPPAAASGGLSAHLQVINAAPYADPSGAGAGATITFTFAGATPGAGVARYRASSGYLNPPSGTYTLTMTVTDATSASYTIYSQPVTLAPGEVRTFVVQSTGYAAVPSPANTKVTNILDNAW